MSRAYNKRKKLIAKYKDIKILKGKRSKLSESEVKDRDKNLDYIALWKEV